jgi:beta-galactosidase GanA
MRKYTVIGYDSYMNKLEEEVWAKDERDAKVLVMNTTRIGYVVSVMEKV